MIRRYFRKFFADVLPAPPPFPAFPTFPQPAPIVIELDAVKHELAQLHNQLAGLHHSVKALVQIEAKRERHEIAQRGY